MPVRRTAITGRIGSSAACLLVRARGITGVIRRGSGIADIMAAAGVVTVGAAVMHAAVGATDMKDTDEATLAAVIMPEAAMVS